MTDAEHLKALETERLKEIDVEGLARAVLGAALKDGCDDPKERGWFSLSCKRFNLICELAGQEPSQVRRVALECFAKHDAGASPLAILSENSVEAARRAATPKRETRVFTYNGRTLTLKEWSAETGISLDTLDSRLRSNWTVEQALTLPVGTKLKLNSFGRNAKAKLYTCNGKSQSLKAWADELGVSKGALLHRFKSG